MVKPVPETFPVLWPHRRGEQSELEKLGCPRHVPWSLVVIHEDQARNNHHQSVAELAARGGLDPRELYAVLRDISWSDARYIPLDKVVAKLRDLVDEHEKTP